MVFSYIAANGAIACSHLHISPRSLRTWKLMFTFCGDWVRQNSYQTICSLNMDMAVFRKQKAILKMAFRYVFIVAFTHAMKKSKLLLHFSNSLFWILFFSNWNFNDYFAILKITYWWDIHPDRSRFFKSLSFGISQSWPEDIQSRNVERCSNLWLENW